MSFVPFHFPDNRRSIFSSHARGERLFALHAWVPWLPDVWNTKHDVFFFFLFFRRFASYTWEEEERWITGLAWLGLVLPPLAACCFVIPGDFFFVRRRGGWAKELMEGVFVVYH